MSEPRDDSADEGDGEPTEPNAQLAALVQALAGGDPIDWQRAESEAGSEQEREQVRALAAISTVATFHRTWLALGGITGDLDEEEALDEEVPTHWGELEILERVGRGSFGDVYKAREPRLDRIVALKLIRASAKTPEREAETLREGRLLAKVRHPNVATVHGAAGADGRVGFWMEFLEGKNLAEILAEQGCFEPRAAAEVGIALCRALAAVHAQGIIHRDVKAQNVVRENDGRIVLTDFGVGRDATPEPGDEPSLSGTPLYLAPELFEGKPPSPATDLYALGVLLFYLATGEFPVTGSSFEELRAAHRDRKRRWLKELRKDLPGTFVAAVERALDRDPEKRVVGGVVGLERELGKFLGERLGRRRRIQKSSAAIAAGLVIAGGIFAFVERDQIATWVNLKYADRFHDSSQFQLAVSELEEAKRRSPELPDIYWRLMSCRSADGNYVGALEASREGVPLCQESRSWNCHMVRAWSALLRLDYNQALRSFTEAEKIGPDDEIRRQIILAQVNLGHPELAVQDAEALANAEEIGAASLFASTLSAADHYPKAMKALDALRERFPESELLHWVAGTVMIAAGDAMGAEKEFKAMVTQPDDPGDASNGRLLWAQALMFQSKFDEAKRVLLDSASMDTREKFDRNQAIRSILLAECYVRTGNPREASHVLSSIFDQEQIPTNLKLFRNAALVGLEAGDISLVERLATVVSLLEKEYSTDLSQSFDFELRGELASRMGDSEKAVELLELARSVRDDPQNALSMARVQIGRDRCDDALAYLDLVVSRRGLIVNDFYTPWTILNEAKELQKQCSTRK